MIEKKQVRMGGMMKIVIFLWMLLLVGVHPVTASESYEIVLEELNFDYLYPDISMFSPSTGYLAVQGTSIFDGYPLGTSVFAYDISWKNESGELKFDMDLKSQKVKESGKTHNPSIYGTRSAYVNGTNYVFTQDNGLYVDAFTLTPPSVGSDEWNAKWGNRYTINYKFDGTTNFDNLQVVGGSSGVYLVSKHTEDKVPYLEIAFINLTSLEGASTKITPQLLYKFKNDDSGFHPVPDTRLYDALVTQHMDNGKDVIIGVSDYKSTLLSWYIGPDGYGNKTLVNKTVIKDDFYNYYGNIKSVFLQEGNCQGAETEADSITAMVLMDTEKQPLSGGLQINYNCNLPAFASNDWNQVYKHSGTSTAYLGAGPVTAFTAFVQIPGTENLWSMVMYGTTYESDMPLNNFGLAYYASNQLVAGQIPPEVVTDDDLATYGNLITPVGVIDGVVPISLNGHECDDLEVLSTIKVNDDQKNTTKTSTKNLFKTTISYGHEFFHDKLGIDSEYANAVGNTQDTDVTQTSTVHTSCQLCGTEDEVNGTFLYVALTLITYPYNVTDFYGNPSKTNPQSLYLTMVMPNNGEQFDFISYNLTNPKTSGIMAGALASPVYDDFSDWDWTTMSGGWFNRNWDLSPYDQNFTDENLFNCPLHWTPTTKDIPSADTDSSYSDTNTIEEEVSTSVALLGLKTGETYTNEQENTVSSAISQAIDFEWGMIKNESICGVTDLKIEPLLLTPKKQKKPGDYYCPWVPKMFGNYTPWFLTFNVLNVSYNDNCNPSAAAMESRIATNALPKGAGTIILPSGGIPVGTTGQVQAVPASGYRFLHWKGYGMELEDYSSPVTNATVTSQLSTLRAFFAKQSSDLVDTAMISIQNGSTGNQVKLQGTLPAGFNTQVALHHKTPVEVTIGSLVFPFGFGVGNVTVVSDHEIAYTTEDSANGVSHLRVDFGTNNWWFSANQVQDLARYGVKSDIVDIGIEGEDISAEDNILMTGEEGISWSGKNEAVSNGVISLQNATLSGRLNFLNDKSDLSTLALAGGDLKVKSVTSTDPIRFTLNDLEFGFEKPTRESGNLFTYQRTGKDLNATITVNNQTMKWSAELDGERISHDYIRSGISIGLRVGDKYGSVSIYPNLTASLKTTNIDTSSLTEDLLT